MTTTAQAAYIRSLVAQTGLIDFISREKGIDGLTTEEASDLIDRLVEAKASQQDTKNAKARQEEEKAHWASKGATVRAFNEAGDATSVCFNISEAVEALGIEGRVMGVVTLDLQSGAWGGSVMGADKEGIIAWISQNFAA